MIADKPLNVNHDFAKGVLLGFLLPFCSFACLLYVEGVEYLLSGLCSDVIRWFLVALTGSLVLF
jgi:hypothetical protein